MKLLSKKEINTATAKSQKQTYDEGIKLARRVDGLREVAAAEEASLEKFRRETLARIHEEITQETSKRDSLRQEVFRLQKEREEAIKPLDSLGERLAEEDHRIRGEREVLNEAKDAFAERERKLDSRDNALRDEEARISEQKRVYSELLAYVRDDRNSTRTALEDAQRALSDNTLEAARLAKERADFESSKKETEARQAKRDKEQDEREVILNARETKVLDREGAYTRQLKRNGH